MDTSVMISISSFAVSLYALWIARDNRKRSISFINVDYDLVIRDEIEYIDANRSIRKYFVKFILSNRGSSQTSIRRVSLICFKIVGKKSIPFVIRPIADPKSKSIYNSEPVAKLSPGEMLILDLGKDLFEGIRQEGFLPNQYGFKLEILHSQKDRPDFVQLRDLEKEISRFSTGTEGH